MISISFLTKASLVFLSLTFSANAIRAEEIRVAVASNFKTAMTSIVEAYEQQSSHRVVLSYGSTGKHYAQIKNGAPFDLFYSADSERSILLEQQGLVVEGSRFTYALGKLVLWSPKQEITGSLETLLSNQTYRYLAMANPKLSPYGLAAQQTIVNLSLFDSLNGKIIQGENIAQTFQYVYSGNADLGLVAYAQIVTVQDVSMDTIKMVPQNLYELIDQQAVMLKKTEASESFFKFSRSQIARDIILAAGYNLP
ncbi:MAG: molybdate ABC transporter substrate-binding protein [Acidiferrobacterales bacterium]|nr:molybdate ABC transporter substrate-binding protein [Acidiferrobacterales bacterium]